jgi:hypothetical protein
MKRSLGVLFSALGIMTTVSCAGRIAVNDAAFKGSSVEEGAGSEAVVGENAFMLDLPDFVKKDRDVLKVRLNGPDGLEYERKFVLGKAPVVINRLPAGEYKIVLELMHGGVLKERGIGKVLVESKRVAQADVLMESAEKGQGGIEIHIRKPEDSEQLNTDGVSGFTKRLQLFSEKAQSFEIRQDFSVPGCAGFHAGYSKIKGEVNFGGCLPGTGLNLPPIVQKLSETQKAFLETLLAKVVYSPSEEMKMAMVCVPQGGAKTRVVTVEEPDGKKLVVKVDGPECVNNVVGILHSDEFEDLANDFLALVKEGFVQK